MSNIESRRGKSKTLCFLIFHGGLILTLEGELGYRVWHVWCLGRRVVKVTSRTVARAQKSLMCYGYDNVLKVKCDIF